MPTEAEEKRPLEPDDMVGPLRSDQVVNTGRLGDELWGENPMCRHHIVAQPRGGVRCIKCQGWCCY